MFDADRIADDMAEWHIYEHFELERLLTKLPLREAQALRLRFGLDGGEHTYDEIAREVGYSHRESARLAVQRGLAKLRRAFRTE